MVGKENRFKMRKEGKYVRRSGRKGGLVNTTVMKDHTACRNKRRRKRRLDNDQNKRSRAKDSDDFFT